MAGPSSKPAATSNAKASSSKTGKAGKSGKAVSVPEDAIILYSEEETEAEPEAPPPLPKNKAKAAAPSGPAAKAKAKTATTGKGKAKEDSVVQETEDAMEVDELQAEDPPPPTRPKQPRPAAKPPQKAQTRPQRDNAAHEALERENARLKKSLEDVRRVSSASRTTVHGYFVR